MNNFETLTTQELINVKGGAWDGRCGYKKAGNWFCGTPSDGDHYQFSTVKGWYDSGETDGWCCASCGDSNKCGQASLAPE